MYIYRIQNKYGRGPYTDFNCHLWKEKSHNDSNHPNPFQDGLRDNITFPPEKWVCGFISLEQLSKWFTKQELINLYNHDFFITKLRIKKEYVQKGNKQIIFFLSKTTMTKYFNKKAHELFINSYNYLSN